MFFYLSKILGLVGTPLGLILVLLAASLALIWLGRVRAASYCIGVALTFLALAFFTPVSVWLVAPIENRFAIPPAPRCVDGIIALGGGELISESGGRATPLLRSRPMRYIILSELMRRYPDVRVVFSGGSGSLTPGTTSESDVAGGLMGLLGLETNHVVFESTSRTTWENLTNAKAMVAPRPGERWVLLAAAIQLPRAVGVARKLNWDVLPWPTDYITGGSSWSPRIGVGPIGFLEAAEHEWVGLLAYWISGRSSALFPGPDDLPPDSGDCSSNAKKLERGGNVPQVN